VVCPENGSNPDNKEGDDAKHQQLFLFCHVILTLPLFFFPKPRPRSHNQLQHTRLPPQEYDYSPSQSNQLD
jgi:hypothetical protein